MSPCQGEGRGFDSRLALSEISKKPDDFRLLFTLQFHIALLYRLIVKEGVIGQNGLMKTALQLDK